MNASLFQDINNLAGHVGALDEFMKFSALYLVFLTALVAPLLWFWPGPEKARAERQRVAASTVLAAAVALAVGAVAGALHSETRPFVDNPSVHLLISHPADNGFPSDHATAVFAFATVVLGWRRSAGLVMVVLALLVAFARVFVGVHWPNEVLAGAGIGIAVGVVAMWAEPLWTMPQRLLSRVLPEWLVAEP